MLERNHLLLENNRALLEQGLDLLERITEDAYRKRLPELGGASIGGHLRHILEFYECFFDGLRTNRVDYDSRQRDEAVETRIEAASQKLRLFLRKLRTEPKLREDGFFWVRMEDAPDFDGDALLTSSHSRELQVLQSHTTHHFALVAVALRLQGIPVDPQFGVALSTLRFWESRKAAA